MTGLGLLRAKLEVGLFHTTETPAQKRGRPAEIISNLDMLLESK